MDTKTIPIKPYTRAIDREYNKILMHDAKTIANGNGDVSVDVNPNNISDANDYLVKAMFWLEQEHIDNMQMDEYDALLAKANNAKTFPKTAV